MITTGYSNFKTVSLGFCCYLARLCRVVARFDNFMCCREGRVQEMGDGAFEPSLRHPALNVEIGHRAIRLTYFIIRTI
jgi:hypothetical protein